MAKTSGPRSWEDLVLDGMEARQQADATRWRLGDLASEVATGYGEGKLQDYADRIDVDYDTLRNYRWVARRFDQSARRRANLAFGHFDAVASRPDAELWLMKAERGRWSVRRLRDSVREAKARERAREIAKLAARVKFDSNFHKGKAQDLIDDPKKGLENGSVKLLLTDPPYGMDRTSPTPDSEERYGIEGDLTRKQAADLLREVLTKLQPKLRPDAMCAVFCEWDDATLQKVVEEFFVVHGRVRWDKGGGIPGTFFVYDAEDIVIGTRKGIGKKKAASLPPTLFYPLHGTLLYARTQDFLRIHPMEKPLLLLSELILSMTKTGDIVADPFAGSGSTLLAAAGLGRRYWGAELNRDAAGREKDWYPRGVERLRKSGGALLGRITLEEPLLDMHALGNRYNFRHIPYATLIHILNQYEPAFEDPWWHQLHRRLEKLRRRSAKRKSA